MAEWCYSGQNVGVIKPQHVGVTATPVVRLVSLFFDFDLWPKNLPSKEGVANWSSDFWHS